MKSDSRWRSLLTTLVVAVGLGGSAPAARAAPCEPPLTLDECDLLVASSATNSVLRYDGATGDFLGEFVAAGSGGLEKPVGIVFGPDDNLYVSMNGGTEPRVLRYDGATGDFLGPFTAVMPDGIRIIVFGPDGNLYGATGGTVFRADGTTGASLGTFVDLGLGELTSGVTFGPDGNLYVGNFFANQVLRRDATTGDIDVFAEVPIVGSAGHAGLTTFGPDGNLYVGLYERNDIWVFDGTTGASLGSFIPAADPHPQAPWILIFGPDANLYVASSSTDEVLRYNGTTGAFIDVFASGGGLDGPTGLVFVPEPGQALLMVTSALVLAAVRRRCTA